MTDEILHAIAEIIEICLTWMEAWLMAPGNCNQLFQFAVINSSHLK
jgi:hypothetical protein